VYLCLQLLLQMIQQPILALEALLFECPCVLAMSEGSSRVLYLDWDGPVSIYPLGRVRKSSSEGVVVLADIASWRSRHG
jgi:hypothetical protein